MTKKTNEEIDEIINKALEKNGIARPAVEAVEKDAEEGEHTGGSVDYYQLSIRHPTTSGRVPYTVECNDIIEALGMTFAEGNVFKALWRSCATRIGKKKRGHDHVYDAEKIVFFAERMLTDAKLHINPRR